jgi:hypothetical protein
MIQVLMEDIIMFVLMTKLVCVLKNMKVFATAVGMIRMLVLVLDIRINTSRESIDSDQRSYEHMDSVG